MPRRLRHLAVFTTAAISLGLLPACGGGGGGEGGGENTGAGTPPPNSSDVPPLRPAPTPKPLFPSQDLPPPTEVGKWMVSLHPNADEPATTVDFWCYQQALGRPAARQCAFDLEDAGTLNHVRRLVEILKNSAGYEANYDPTRGTLTLAGGSLGAEFSFHPSAAHGDRYTIQVAELAAPRASQPETKTPVLK